MVPWSRVTDLPPNAKLREMQQNTLGMVQLIRAATSDGPDQTPMPTVQAVAQCVPYTTLLGVPMVERK